MYEPRYTLHEAAQILNRQVCKASGHDFEVITYKMTGHPMGIRCIRCRDYWRVLQSVNQTTQVMPKIDDSTQVLPRLHQ